MSAPKPTKTNPHKYLKIVKNKLRNKRDIYVRFLQVMTAYTAHRIDPNGVKSVVKELFKEDQELISGFNTFLPKGFEITLNCEQTPPTNFIDVEYSEALDFVRMVKSKFGDKVTAGNCRDLEESVVVDRNRVAEALTRRGQSVRTWD
ncbi:unnamed protein product [Arabidopsis arenosa]|uniref:Uncharacterized protein n=1 Tax=Arabidopsis arenosa TaxID=38785 RepID=A0A8S2AVN9_ARAAE|nr:unnamed protein product [Arabidopsis arenosa]